MPQASVYRPIISVSITPTEMEAKEIDRKVCSTPVNHAATFPHQKQKYSMIFSIIESSNQHIAVHQYDDITSNFTFILLSSFKTALDVMRTQPVSYNWRSIVNRAAVCSFLITDGSHGSSG